MWYSIVKKTKKHKTTKQTYVHHLWLCIEFPNIFNINIYSNGWFGNKNVDSANQMKLWDILVPSCSSNWCGFEQHKCYTHWLETTTPPYMFEGFDHNHPMIFKVLHHSWYGFRADSLVIWGKNPSTNFHIECVWIKRSWSFQTHTHTYIYIYIYRYRYKVGRLPNMDWLTEPVQLFWRFLYQVFSPKEGSNKMSPDSSNPIPRSLRIIYI